MLSRPLVTLESGFLHNAGCLVNCGLEISKTKRIPEIVEKIRKYMIGTHCSTDGKMMYSIEPKDPIRIPNGFSNLQDASSYFAENKVLPYSKSLASIGYNDHQIVIATQHLAGDGIYFVNLLRNIQDPNYVQKKLPIFPEPASVAFSKEIEQVDRNFVYYDRAPMTTIISKEPEHLIKPGKTQFCPNHMIKIPLEKLQAYSKETKKVHHLTEYLWTALALSVFAYEDKILPFGCVTCVDLRSFLKEKKGGPQHADLFSFIYSNAPIHPDFTVQKAGQMMRNDFSYRFNRGDVFNRFVGGPKGVELPGSIALVSPLPPIVLSDPIDDVIIHTSLPNARFNSLYINTTSVIHKDKGTSEFVGFLRNDPGALAPKEAQLIANSVKYFLMNIKPNMTIKETVQELKEFQNHTK